MVSFECPGLGVGIVEQDMLQREITRLRCLYDQQQKQQQQHHKHSTRR
jgi:hypothetical protein